MCRLVMDLVLDLELDLGYIFFFICKGLVFFFLFTVNMKCIIGLVTGLIKFSVKILFF
jgi:hypothetical protein